MEALVDIGAPCGFANRMQTPAPQLGLQLVNGFKMRPALAQPLRQPGLSRWRKPALNLNKSRHETSFWHEARDERTARSVPVVRAKELADA